MNDANKLKQKAAKLLDAAGFSSAVTSIIPCTRGGNNRTFILQTPQQRFALKEYFRQPDDKRDRLQSEYSFLRYAQQTAPGMVPQAYAKDDEAGLALYEFIDGKAIEAGELAETDVFQAADFFVALNQHHIDARHPDAVACHPDEVVCHPGAGRDLSDEVARHPGEGRDPSGKVVRHPGEGRDLSNEMVCHPGEGRDPSNEMVCHPGAGRDPSDEMVCHPGEGRDPSGKVVRHPGEGRDLSNEMVCHPGAGRDLSNEMVCHPGEGRDPSLISRVTNSEPNPNPLPNASEACFSIKEHLNLVDARITNLSHLNPEMAIDTQAQQFINALVNKWSMIKDEVIKSAQHYNLPLDEQLAPENRCISPSDFGFHNALKRTDGTICFLDFEYAGWDDPAKMVGDFFAQLAVPVPQKYFTQFTAQVMQPFQNASMLEKRATLLKNVYQIKWCCIAMNVFIPVHLARRKFANPHLDVLDLKRNQLAKAQTLIKRLEVSSYV